MSASNWALAWGVFAFCIGAGFGLVSGIQLSVERERGAVTENQSPRLDSVALPTLRLRCENEDPPRVWTRIEAEARMHTAQMSLRSAEFHGVWTDLGNRWSGLARGQMQEVELCWGGEP